MKSNAAFAYANNTQNAANIQKPGEQITTATLFKSSLLFQTKEFFNNSTLHGVRYIAETGRPFGEKFMWFCFTSIGGIAALIIIFSLWEKFQTNPTITGLDTDFHNQQVVFPSVVICPHAPYNDTKVKDYAYKTVGSYEDGSEKYEPFLEMLTQLSYSNVDELYRLSLNFTESWASVDKMSLRKHAFGVVADCDDIFDGCKYKNDDIPCCKHFLPIYIEHGFCFAFNTRYKDTADYEEKNSLISDMFETDKKWALSFKLKTKSSIFIHSFEESSGWDFKSQFVWDIMNAVDVLISMKQTYTTDDARQLSINQRKCIFPNEQKLKYYNDDYTFTGCMRECRIKKAIHFCHCAPPFYRPTNSYRLCSVKDLKCLGTYRHNITSIKGCRDCELSCHNTVYDIEKLTKVSLDTSVEKNDPVITIEYLTWPIVRYKREVLFGWVDLLVSFGGIAGLFLGFSLLSGVEIIYYFTLRACCMLYKNREDLYKIEYEKMQKPPERYNLSLKPSKKRQRSNSLPSSITSMKELTTSNDTNAMFRVGTRFMKADTKFKNNNSNQSNKNPVLVTTVNMISRGSKQNLSYLKPNFKLGKIAPYDIYSNRHLSTTSLGNFTYMP